MKTKTTILFVLIMNSVSIYSQSSFEFILQDTLSSRCYTTFIDYQNYYVSLGSTGNPITYEYAGLLLKFQNPNDILITTFNKPDTSLFFRFGILMDNGNYYVAGLIDDNDDVYRKNLYIVEINQDLEIINEKIYGIPEEYNSLELHNLLLTADSTVILSGSLDDPAPGNINHLYVAKLNIHGELLDTLVNTQFDEDYGSEILEKPDKSGYYIIGTFPFAELIELDDNINIIGYQPLDPDNIYHGALGVRWLSDGNLIIGSLANQEVPGAFYDLRVRVSDTNLEAIKDTVIFDDGWNWLPALSGLDFIDENNIWIATYPKGGKSTTDWEYGRIYIFDSNLNIKGAKYFGGTTSLYLYSLKALDDGGCIITGKTPDESGNGYDDVYIKKLMPYDVITYAEETEDINDSDVIIFPVPFNQELHIETYRKDLLLSLFAFDGKCILMEEPLKIPNTIILTSNIIKGFYFYSIIEKGKTIQSGKIIKQ